MRQEFLRPDLLLCVFDGPARGYGANVVAAIDGKRALLIDPGNPDQAAAVRDELAARGVSVASILLTHGHRDHAGGCAEFPDIPVICREGTVILAESHGPEKRPPASEELAWGSLRMLLYDTSGHVGAHQIALIDDLCLCGDLIIFSGDDRPVLPNVDKCGDPALHAAGLRRMLELLPSRVLPYHGPILAAGPDLEADVAARLRYLDRLAELGPGAKLSDCLADREYFTHLHMHRLNGGRGG